MLQFALSAIYRFQYLIAKILIGRLFFERFGIIIVRFSLGVTSITRRKECKIGQHNIHDWIGVHETKGKESTKISLSSASLIQLNAV